ncbi:CocE/NonD family hydrolase [Pseudonocardia alni]|uniref:CocE/NonD family hydrolase n=1 Tax=Pseudonocardia alni TaxID=33907 RepID=UPI00333064C8
MRYRDAFPRRTETVDAWIPTRDGTRLHARIQLPVDALDDPVPALLEYLPYRKDDWTAPRDAARHPWYAGHGYASVRVDVRGTGDSEGLLLDEYTPAELADGVDVVEWLAAQPWCTGRVGMFGISWGGFNALQVAALAPDALQAVVTVCSTDDRYDNDVHYTGGAVLGIDMAGWSGTMLAFTARPPDPAVVGERWLPMWRERLEAAEPFVHHWLAHPERDDYWRHGSVCEDPSAIRAAVLAVGGWNDPYRDTVLRLLSTLDAPVRGIVGPWAHRYPDIELPPGPAIGFLQETLRWWDRWLKDEPTGVEDDPPLRAWIQEPVRPATTYPERPGRWVGTPAVGETVRELVLGSGSEPVVVAAPDHTGIDAGRYFPFGNPTDLPPDQRAEDGRSVCFDLGPLPERVEILGRPVVRLRLDADRPAAAVVVRLCTVDDDGASTLVTRGVLNLTRRHGRDRTVPWTPGVPETVEVPLMATGSAVPAGGRLRVAVSQTYWPWVWPHPEPVRLTVVPGRSSLTLPLNTGTDLPATTFGPPEQAPPLPVTTTPPPDRPEREVLHDVGTGTWELRVDPRYGGSRTFPDGLSYAEDTRETYRITDGDPLSARAESAWTIAIGRGDWRTDVETRSVLTATATDFVADSSLVARHGDEVVAERRWHRTIPRRGA